MFAKGLFSNEPNKLFSPEAWLINEHLLRRTQKNFCVKQELTPLPRLKYNI
jgi:hypothetical protein